MIGGMDEAAQSGVTVGAASAEAEKMTAGLKPDFWRWTWKEAVWGVVYAILLTPPVCMIVLFFSAQLRHVTDPDSWIWQRDMDFGYWVMGMSPYVILPLLLLWYLPSHPMPMFKKIGLVAVIVVVIFWMAPQSDPGIFS
jgi:hypothetical protein